MPHIAYMFTKLLPTTTSTSHPHSCNLGMKLFPFLQSHDTLAHTAHTCMKKAHKWHRIGVTDAFVLRNSVQMKGLKTIYIISAFTQTILSYRRSCVQ